MKEMDGILRRMVLPLVLLCSCADAFASQIILKNGDRITGTITASGNDGLRIHSALIGDVEIPWNAVERVNIEEQVFVPAGFRNNARRPQRTPASDPTKTQGPRSSLDGAPQTSDFLRHWSGSLWAAIVAHAGRNTQLLPGDVLGSGTVGTGCILEHGDGRWLQPGDEVELEVEGIGRLRNRIG